MPLPKRPENTGVPRLLRDAAHERILAAIIDGTLQPGDPLQDDELMAWLGTSRAPVRDALNRLAESGIIELRPHRTALVAPIDIAMINQALGAVAPLFEYAVETVIPLLDAEMLAELDRLADAASAAASANDRRALDVVNREFFTTFARATGNQVLVDTVEELVGLTARALTPRADLSDISVIADHVSRIRDAAKARDAKRAVALMRELSAPTHANFVTEFRPAILAARSGGESAIL